jgi:hypothetical protein
MKFEQQAQKFSVVSRKTAATPTAPVAAKSVVAKIILKSNKCAAVSHNWDERVADDKSSIFYLREEDQYDRFDRLRTPRSGATDNRRINNWLNNQCKMPEKQGMPIANTEPGSQTSFGSYRSERSDSFCEDADYFK